MFKIFRLIILSLLTFSYSFAEKVYLEADSIEKIKKSTIIAKGNVVLKYKDIIVKSKELTFDQINKSINYNTKTEIISPKFKIVSDSGWYNLDNKSGEFYNVSIILENKYFIKAREVNKKGKIFFFKQAKFSSCPFTYYDWFVYSTSGNVKKDDYLRAKNVFFLFCKVPLFYTPYFLYPTSKRKTGFLPFSISQDTYNTFMLKIPFYWAINRTSDATITLDYRNKQGKGLEVEYRKRFSPYSEIKLKPFYFKENSIAPWWNGRGTDRIKERWLLSGDGRFKLGENTKIFLKIDIPSDKYFYEDFYNTSPLRYTSYTKSQLLSLTETQNFTIETNFDFIYDLTLPNNETTLQRLPEVRFYWKEKPLFKNVYYDFLSINTNFYRERGQRGIRSDNQFRVLLSNTYGSITNFLELMPRSTFYFSITQNEDKNPSRNIFWLKDRISTIFQKDYGNFYHNIIPSLEFNYISRVNQENLPYFDKEDRINAKKDIDFSLFNILDFKNNNFFRWEISSGYTFLDNYYIGDASFKGHKKPLKNSFIYNINGYTGENTLFFDLKKQQIVRTISSFSFPIFSHLKYVISHSFDKGENSSTNQLLHSIYTGWKYFSLNFSILSNIKEGYIQQKRGSLKFDRGCWFAQIDYMEDFNRQTGKSYKVITFTLNIVNFRYNIPILKPSK